MSILHTEWRFWNDKSRKPLFLEIGDSAYIKLHKGYKLPAANSKKLSQQRCGPFQVVQRYGRLVYRLDIPKHWRIHDVFSITHLELAPKKKDSFDRPRPEHPDSVYVEWDTDYQKSREIEKIIDEQVSPAGRVRYLVLWKGYGPEDDQWFQKFTSIFNHRFEGALSVLRTRSWFCIDSTLEVDLLQSDFPDKRVNPQGGILAII